MSRWVRPMYTIVLVVLAAAGWGWAGLPAFDAALLFLVLGIILLDAYHLLLPGGLTYSLTLPLVVAGVAHSGPGTALFLAMADGLVRIVMNPKWSWTRRIIGLSQATVAGALAAWVYLQVPPSLSVVAGGLAGAAFLAANVTLVVLMVLTDPDPSPRLRLRPALRATFQLQLLEVVGSAVMAYEMAQGHFPLVALLLVMLFAFSLTSHQLVLARFESRQDRLTKVWNLRGFADDMQISLDLYHQTKKPFGLILMDIDAFKSINDTYGHDAGNDVLQVVAQRLRHHVRPGDGVYRIGGEEFAIILPDIQRAPLDERMRHLQEAVRREPIALTDGTSLEVTVSAGAAWCPEDGTDYESLFRRADQALYRAKERYYAQLRLEPRGETRGDTTPLLTSEPDPGLHYQAR
ncbi:MAG: GGDEF domain-containing protein [Clostridiales bacterium]|nr:GGDEF domain-containing protein [Clostridiales bacterium]